MNKIYENEDEYNEAFDKDLADKIEMLSYYQGEVERETLDGDWTETELKEDLEDIVMKVLHGEVSNSTGWLSKHKCSAVKNKELLHDEFVYNAILEDNDLIEVYNSAVDRHRNDEHKLFGIHYFDEEITKKVMSVLNNNLVG
jgi:hypothetical protein